MVTCGGDLAREGASQSALCSEKNNRIVSGSLTALIGITLQELCNIYVEGKEEDVAGCISPGGEQVS